MYLFFRLSDTLLMVSGDSCIMQCVQLASTLLLRLLLLLFISVFLFRTIEGTDYLLVTIYCALDIHVRRARRLYASTCWLLLRQWPQSIA